jgi:hypothetical protein
MSVETRYFVEALDGGRGKAYVDYVEDGRVVLTVTFGSPAPIEDVERFVASVEKEVAR